MNYERYQFGGWTDPRAVYGNPLDEVRKYGWKYINKRGLFGMGNKKVDAHEYVTEAKDLPIEACASLWVIKYGNEPVAMQEVNDQDKLMWEVGNRLWWANRLEYDQSRDIFICKS